MSALTAAGVGNALTAVAAPVISGAFTLGGIKRQYEYNKQLMEQQNQFNLEMWKLQNEYNSPQAQMQRYQDAGLNPLLIYGQGSSGNASSAPVKQVPAAPNIEKGAEEIGKMFNVANLVSTALDLQRKENENALIRGKVVEQEQKNLSRSIENQGKQEFSAHYRFNPVTGRYEYINPDGFNYTSDNYRHNWWIQDRLAKNYYQNLAASTIPYRNAYLFRQSQFLVPQIKMKEFESKHQPNTYFLDRASGKNIGGYVNAIGHYLGWW